MKLDALCELGGQTEIVEGDWTSKSDERSMVSDGGEGFNLKKGMCVKPEECHYRDRCSGKVQFAQSSTDGGGVVIYSSRWIRGLTRIE